MEFVRDVDAMEIRLVGLHEVDDVALSLGKANANVKGVDLKTNQYVLTFEETITSLLFHHNYIEKTIHVVKS